MARNFYLTKTYFYRNNPYLCTRIPIKLDLNRLERHNHPPHFHLIYKGICAAQGNDSFSCNNSLDNGVAIKNTLKNSLNYLAIPNNLLLSLSLSLSYRRTAAYLPQTSIIVRAREALRNPHRQRARESSLCLFRRVRSPSFRHRYKRKFLFSFMKSESYNKNT